MPLILSVVYFSTLVGLALYGAHRLKMLVLYGRAMARPRPPAPPLDASAQLCVQLPIFNEPLVVEALLEKVTALRWPDAKWEIQVLDDSTDETTAIIDRWLRAHPAAAARVTHVRRASRDGYKAGALKHGMALSNAEFFAIFDADFRPEPDFFEQLMPHFAADDVAVVQARWEFANRRQSLLTRFQAVFLDAHFVVEQTARAAAGLFFNFNGTAGIWRRTALEDAGGWTSDTVTEDLDASYRAQLRGWRLVYLDQYAVASELPENLIAFKSQQRRWTKGGIQVARKSLRSVFAAKLPGRVKREAWWHLTIGVVHPLLVTFSILFVPYLWFAADQLGTWWYLANPAIVLLAGGAPVAFYVAGQFFQRREWREGVMWLLASPLLLSFGLALSVTLCAAFFEGLFSNGGEFVRTPKGGRVARSGNLLTRLRSRTFFTAVTVIEVALSVVLLNGAVFFGSHGHSDLAFALGLKGTGFMVVALLSASDLWPSFWRARV
ncbi:glycosyltransferase family 2 protein [Synoicihabitans lomoniglobus]|uniref:Glycosyltransferase family 2 protein n=1 Tax=Synoicihabitans lomoniglobus TaxID=2909285 RepID=A0AAF0CH75_9BACT|nr:glycosyltransferase [Opitutaceae bacterium LMO-M01]WED63962.1 glycosyltransferase family 2 protein [Opitutaceae bacterium LMO-M01]